MTNEIKYLLTTKLTIKQHTLTSYINNAVSHKRIVSIKEKQTKCSGFKSSEDV